MKLLVAIFSLSVLLVVGPSPASAGNCASFEELASNLSQFVRKRYPNVQFEATKTSVTFKFDTRKFMVHESAMTGEWQEARPEEGPNPGGILGEVHLNDGPYKGQAVAPQTFDKRYFIVLLQAPNSESCDAHLHSLLYYTPRTDTQFVKEYGELIDGFSKSGRTSR